MVGGWFLLDVTIESSGADKASLTDNVADTINYAEVYDAIKDEMSTPSNLIEHVAGRIYRRIKSSFSLADKVTVSITKKHPPVAGANFNASVVVGGSCFARG